MVAAGLAGAQHQQRVGPVGNRVGLPRWEVVGLEVLERQVFLSRGMEYNVIIDLHDVTPLPF